MPFLVKFAEPVMYMAESKNPRVRRMVSSLWVHAPTREGAIIHAHRVTKGAIDVIACEEGEIPVDPPAQEDPRAYPTMRLTGPTVPGA